MQAHLPPVHTHKYAHALMCIHTCTVIPMCNTQSHSHVHMHTYANIESNGRTHAHTYRVTHIGTCTCAVIHTCRGVLVIGEKSLLRAPLFILPFPSFCSLLALPLSSPLPGHPLQIYQQKHKSWICDLEATSGSKENSIMKAKQSWVETPNTPLNWVCAMGTPGMSFNSSKPYFSPL